MGEDLVARIKWTFLSSLDTAPTSLQPFFRTMMHKLDGLESTLFAIAQGVHDAVPEHMQIWHPDLAPSGYRSWARAYFERVESMTAQDLPNPLDSRAEHFLDNWRRDVLTLVEEASRIYPEKDAP